MSRASTSGLPVDMTHITRLNNMLTLLLPKTLVNWTTERALNHKYDHGLYGLKPRHRWNVFTWMFLSASWTQVSCHTPSNVFISTILYLENPNSYHIFTIQTTVAAQLYDSDRLLVCMCLLTFALSHVFAHNFPLISHYGRSVLSL